MMVRIEMRSVLNEPDSLIVEIDNPMVLLVVLAGELAVLAN